MQIQDVYNLEIFIDGANLFTTPGVIFKSADLYEAVMNPIPTCKLEIIVPLAWIDQRSIVDGTEIRFTLVSDKFKINSTYIYRLFNITKIEVTQKFATLELEGVLDFHQGYLQGNTFNKFTSTSTIMQDIANTYALTAEIDSTNDSQLWVAGENNTYQFMSALTQRAWINDTSAMFWCFDRNKRLLYKNLTTLFRNRQTNIWSFIQTQNPNIADKQYGYSKATASIQAGINNLKNEGYGGTDYQFDLLSYSWQEIFARKVVAESNLINISKDLSQGLYKNWYPFDIGNFHANYEKAYKQNKRIFSTYSSYVTLDCQFFQPIRLGQVINFQYLDSQDINNKISCLSGIYLTSAIHIKLTTSSITSNVELVMQGLNGFAATREVY